MAIILENRKAQFYLMSADWARLLQLAKDYGWIASGTVAVYPSNPMPTPGVAYRPLKDWGGEDYALNNFGVEAADAAQMGQALQRALKEISSDDIIDRFVEDEILDGNSERTSLPLTLTESGFSYRVREGEGYKIEADSEILFVDARADIKAYFSGAMQPCVAQFIKFCSQGRFIIFALGRQRNASTT